MDLTLFLWILFCGMIPPACLGAVLLYVQYKMGKIQLQHSIEGLRAYAKGELLEDVGNALSTRINAVFGGVSKQGSAEGQAATLAYAKDNPGISKMLMNVAGRSGARWLARKLGVPKDTADMLAGIQSQQGINLQALANYQQPQQDPGVPDTLIPPQLSNIAKVLK